MNSPSSFIPRLAGDFIGPAGKLAAVLERKAERAKAGNAPVKLLLHGEPGTGKTALANLVAARLAGHATQIESVNGRNVTIETVRGWQSRFHYRHLAGGFAVIIINEGDTIPAAAQDALLTALDELPGGWAVVVTCNSRLDQITPRLQTRFQQFAVMLPAEGEIAALLGRFGLNGHAARIAASCKGNVRAALLDAQSVLDCQPN